MKNRYLIRRFFAFYIDGMIASIILHISLYVCNTSAGQMMARSFPIYLAIFFFYYVFFDFFFGKTLGKKILQLEIKGFEQKNKAKLLKQVIIRSLFRFVPLDAISILFYEDYRMWHDIVSKTTVSFTRSTDKI